MSYQAKAIKWAANPKWKKKVMEDLEVKELTWDPTENTPDNSPPRTAKPSKLITKSLDSINLSINILERNISSSDLGKVSLLGSSKDSEEENYFLRLSDEVILKILCYLPPSSLFNSLLVCKQWQRIGYDPNLWKAADLSGHHFSSPGVLGSILHRGVKYVRMNQSEVHNSICGKSCFGGSTFLNNALFGKSLCPNFPLQYLDASMAHFADGVLFTLLKKCRFLIKLSLEGNSLNEAHLMAIAGNHNLRELNLSLCKGITSPGMDVLTRKCNQLETLNMSWTDASKEALQKIKRCTKLQKLNIAGLQNSVDHDFIEDIVAKCKGLVALDCSDCIKLNNSALQLICDACTNLRKLAISRCFAIRPNQLQSILKLKYLTQLEIFGFVNKHALMSLQESKPQLRINKQIFSSISRPVPIATADDNMIWEQRIGFIA